MVHRDGRDGRDRGDGPDPGKRREERGMRRRVAGTVVRLASLLVPRERRADWLEEWRAELWHEDELPLVRVALGSAADARAVRRSVRAAERAERRESPTGRRDGWSRPNFMEGTTTMGRELKVAVRSLLRSPGFTAVAVVTLALGIGGATAIWSLVDRIVLDPLPYPESDRLVRVMNQVPGVGPDEIWNASMAQYVHYDEHAQGLEAVGLFYRGGVNIATPAGPERAGNATVTAEVLSLLGAEAEAGRLLGPDDMRPDASPVVVLGHGFWTRTFGADPAVVGRSLSVAGTVMDVVGVLEPGVDLPPEAGTALDPPDLWTPMRIDRSGSFLNEHAFHLVGRLAPGATVASAESDLANLREALPERFPVAYSQAFFDGYGFRTTVTPLKDHAVGDLAGQLWILLGAVGLVLLIACANVANLFLVRMEGRRRELAVRTALGASRGAIGRYLLAESLALTVAGGLGALLVVWQGLPLLVSLAPDAMAGLDSIGLAGSAVAAAAVLAVVVAFFLTLVPLAQLRGGSLRAGLAEGGRGGSATRDRQRLRKGLVAGQVALALTLVVGAGLLLSSQRNLRGVDPGIEPEGVVTAQVHLTPPYPATAEMWVIFDGILDAVRDIPGVAAAGMVRELPLTGGYGCWIQGFEDQAVLDRLRESGQTACAGMQQIGPGYFEAMGIPVLDGRALEEADNYDPGRGSVVVSRAFADRFWPGESPIGKGVKPGGASDDPFYRVVGVVGDVYRSSLQGEKAVAIYYPMVPLPPVQGPRTGSPTLVVKTELDDPMGVLAEVRRAVSSIGASIPISNVQSMEAVVSGSMARLTFLTLLLQVAAAVALLLAAVGLYGVVSYVVSRRTREIGMRMAMGAQPARVQREIVGASAKLAVAGLLVGVVLAAATTQVLEGLLFGVEPTDPWAFLAGAVVLLTVAVMASWLPARRASRVDPSEALRAE